GELPMEAQARLLRLLQEKEIRRLGSTQSRRVDVRVIAATHRNLKQLIKDSLFREDLYFRLNVMEIELPPLRDRGMDILELAQALLKRTIERIGSEPLTFSNCALEAISQYAWPGNIRELENAIERAVILCENDRITPELLAIEATRKVIPDSPKAASTEATGDLSLEDYFQQFVLDNQEHMSETVLASKLGISRKTLWERRNKLGIPRRRGGTDENS
ncbi:MAG: sigma 54-interacting transcriptional regulator, partial [Moraxellaceae bacterium]|nr:sigma 54-interacting transcriptional regulator [Moraxellaceae bacterium]